MDQAVNNSMNLSKTYTTLTPGLTHRSHLASFSLLTPKPNTHPSEPPPPSFDLHDDLQLKILSYFAVRDQVYDTLSQLSRTSLLFLRKHHSKLETVIPSLAHERARLIPNKSIEEHQSGVNQIIKLSNRELVTASDDCYIKYWTLITGLTKNPSSSSSSQVNLKADVSIPTETITCLASTGQMINSSASGIQKPEYLIAGCHSGNLLIINNASIKPGVLPP